MHTLETPLFVGRPNIGDREQFIRRVEHILDQRYFSNNGPFVKEFEREVSKYLGVKNCVAMCNATVALEIAARALNLRGEVIIPSYTFIATAHAIHWQGIKPVFADIDPVTHNICPRSVERLISENTSGIIGVHLWGRPCEIDLLAAIAEKHRLKLMFDASHAFGCSLPDGCMVGNFGECEVFSFHATKFLNSFEGGIVATNDGDLAEKMRLMRNFGFQGFDNVIYPGVNGKMTEICAAMGLTSLEAVDKIVEKNRDNYVAYKECLKGVDGVSLIEYYSGQKNNYQYVVVEINGRNAETLRDKVLNKLHRANVIARKYFWPGCHKMEPYRSLGLSSDENLPNTMEVAARVLVLPTGQEVTGAQIQFICSLIEQELRDSTSNAQ